MIQNECEESKEEVAFRTNVMKLRISKTKYLAKLLKNSDAKLRSLRLFNYDSSAAN